MKQAIIDLIEHNDPERLYVFLNRMYRIMIGLCIALTIALGYDILQWQENKILDRKNSRNAGKIAAIQTSNQLAATASLKACNKNLPIGTTILTGFRDYFNDQARALKPLLMQTPTGGQLHKTREHSYNNYIKIATTLNKILPLKCTTRPKKKDSNAP